MFFASRIAALILAATISLAVPAAAQQRAATNTYGPEELVGAGHRFFGSVSRGLASVIVPHTETIEEVDDMLTLKGLRLIHERNERNQ